MSSNLINKIKNILYSITFGIKGANDEMLSQKANSNTDVIGIQEVVQENKMSKDLLKGEVTQEVEELRYRTYEVEKESKNYEYIGNGLSSKKEKKVKKKLSITNKLICEGILHELNNIDNYGEERYTTHIKYDGIVKFKIEEFITKIDVDVYKENIIKIHFNKIPDKYNVKSRPFINALKAIKEIKNEYEFSKNEICSSIVNLMFITYKVNGEDDFIKYDFIEPIFKSIEETNFEYILTYDINLFKREDLTEKFHSLEMENKYKTKESKKLSLDLTKSNASIVKCENCGKEVSKYDIHDSKTKFNKILCQDCIEKTLLTEK